MEQELLYGSLIGPGKPVLEIEAMNEPDGSGGPGSSCEPNDGMNGGECAARYFADAVQGNAYMGGGTYGHVIAGAFKSSALPSSPNPSNKDCGHEGSFMEGYICYLQNGDGVNIPGAAPLQAYNTFAKSWSFHDYADLVNSENTYCYEIAYQCSYTYMKRFYDALNAWNEPTNDEWVTEAGYVHLCGTSYCNLTNTQELNAAQAWINLAMGGYVDFTSAAHWFWYQYQTTTNSSDTFDSALLDGTTSTGVARQSYCLLTGYPLSDCAGSPNH